MTTWERLYSQMDALVSLQIVIAIEALHTLVALEWTIRGRIRRLLVMRAIHRVNVAIARHHASVHATD